jgi:hypothetical protein
MFAGDHDQAREIFEDLYRTTGAIRVKLEWARAAFLGKRYNLSKRLFDEVLAQDIPDAVRFNVGIYQTEIMRQGGDLTDYGMGIVNDSNPFLATRPQTLYLYGLPFSYEPTRTPERLTGVQAYFSHYRALNDNETLRLLFDGDHTQYHGHDNTKTTLRLALQAKLHTEDNLSLRTGIDHYFEHGRLLIQQPYIGLRWRKDQLTGALNQIQLETRLVKNHYPDYDYMAGHTRSLSAIFAKNLTQTLQLGGTLYIDDTETRLRSQSYQTMSVGAWGQFFLPGMSSSVQLAYTLLRRKFQAPDEIFAIDRQDRRRDVSITIKPYALRLWSFYPALTIGHVESNSNIPLNQYKNTYISTSLRKTF